MILFSVVASGALQQQIPVRFVEERSEAAPTTESWAKLGNYFKVGRASHYKGWIQMVTRNWFLVGVISCGSDSTLFIPGGGSQKCLVL